MDTNLGFDRRAVVPDVFHLRISAVGKFVADLGASRLQSLAGVLGSCMFQEPRI